MKPPPGDWMRAFFREPVFDPGQLEAVAQAPAEARFAARVLGLKRGRHLLDLCCGTGRHSVLLARRGARVTGLDSTPSYLRRAREAGRGVRDLRFVRGDMRRLGFCEEFDAAINLWTSFGYFRDPRDDLRALRGVARALKPRGLFLIDLVNAGWLEARGDGKTWRRRGDGSYVLEEFETRGGRDPGHVSAWTILRRGRPAVRASFFVRNYDWRRLRALLRRAGLKPMRRWGGLDGRPWRPDSQRLVVLARRAC